MACLDKLAVFGLVESAMGQMALHSIGYAFEIVTIVVKRRTENYEKRVLDKVISNLEIGGICIMNQMMTIERVDRTEHVKRKTARPNRDNSIDDTRCDEVAVVAVHRLRSCQNFELKRLLCEVENEAIILRGQVSSYYLKQLAQESVRSLAGFHRLVNRLEVVCIQKINEKTEFMRGIHDASSNQTYRIHYWFWER